MPHNDREAQARYERLGERFDDLSWDIGEAQYGLGKAWTDFNSDSPPQPSHQEILAEGLSPQDQQIMGYHYQSRYGGGKTLINDDGSMTTVLATGVNDPDNQYTISLPGFNNKTGKIIGEGMSQEDRDWAIWQHAVKRFAPEFTLLSDRKKATAKLARMFPSWKEDIYSPGTKRALGPEGIEKLKQKRRDMINADSQRLHKRIEEDDRANRDADQWQQHTAANAAIKRNIADRTGGPIQNLSSGDAAKNFAGAADYALRAYDMTPEFLPPNVRSIIAGLASEGLAQTYQGVDFAKDIASMGANNSWNDYRYDIKGNLAGIQDAMKDPETYPRTPEGLASRGLDYGYKQR